MTDTIEREAKLIEAGSYPDRGIDITEDDLDRIAEGTSEAPVRIEHMATPFDGALGVLKGVYRRGKELFGRLQFTRAAWELITRADARRLSVAVRKDKSGIAEVSLVREPRIADAAVFASSGVVAFAAAELSPGADASFDVEHSTFGSDEVAGLRLKLAEQRTEHMIDEFKREGKIAPAAEILAYALLKADDAGAITFGGQPTPVSRLFEWFLQSQPKVIEFAELAPADPDDDEPEISAKLGVTSRQVERFRER